MNDKVEYWGMPLNTYCMLLHLSQLASFVAPLLGLVLPVVMWVTNKDKSEVIDQHGKAIVNWLISLIIYSIICTILVFVAVGLVGFVVLAAFNIIFAIIAAIKANNGEVWTYPLSFTFIK